MYKAKKLFSMILCLILCTALCLPVAAASVPTITLSNVSGSPGDIVTMTVNISGNPGIMGMTFSITYDKDVFEYQGCTKGVFSSIQGSDKPAKGYVIFSAIENKDINTDGTIMSVSFLIKTNAPVGKRVITLANNNYEKYKNSLHNCFSNSAQKYVVPTVKAGSITIGEPCPDNTHRYDDWVITDEATCTEKGTKNRTCKICKYIDNAEIPAAHNFETDWTVDKVATPESNGIMSRHCTQCDATTDIITFTYEDVEGDDTEDTSSDESSSNESSSNESNSSESNSSESNSTESSSSESNSSESSSSESNNSSDNTSSNKSDNTSSGNTTSQESSSDSTSSDDNASQTKQPVIDNTLGAKNPLSAVENLKDYQENIKPNLPDNTQSDTESSDKNNSSKESSQTDEDAVGADTSVSDKSEDNSQETDSFFATPKGIIVTTLCTVSTGAIISLGVILIIRGKKV